MLSLCRYGEDPDLCAMKRSIILSFLILACWLVSCKQGIVDRDAVRAAVSAQLEMFPESRLQDLYKSFFQDRFGPGHIIRDRRSALDYIQSELADADVLTGPKTEPCGWEGNYVRVNLSVIADSLVTAEALTDALMESAREVNDDDVECWKEEWAEIVSVIEKDHPEIPNLQEDKGRISGLLATGQYAYHHSDAYNEAYHPHYRIITKEAAERLLNPAQTKE